MKRPTVQPAEIFDFTVGDEVRPISMDGLNRLDGPGVVRSASATDGGKVHKDSQCSQMWSEDCYVARRGLLK